VWSNWMSLGGQLASAPTAAANGLNALDVFARSFDNLLLHKWFYFDVFGGHWSPDYDTITDTTLSAPGAVSWGRARIEVVRQGLAASVNHAWYNGSTW